MSAGCRIQHKPNVRRSVNFFKNASQRFLACCLLILLLFADCQPAPLIPDAAQIARLCSEVDAAWSASDWPRVIKNLESIRQYGKRCGSQDPTLTLYPAYYNYGAALDAKNDTASAIDAYRRALTYNPAGREAALALKKREAFTPEPLTICSDERIKNALAAVKPYTPRGSGGYVSIVGMGFTLDNAPFLIHGVNYYPARAPWRRFLTDSIPDVMARELDLIKDAGFNTIRIFVWNDGLFDCPGSGAIPKADALARLDAVIGLAADRGLHVLVTLNDLADLTFHPLYTEPQTASAQTAYLVARYRDEPAILAWDVRNEGDIDITRGAASLRSVMDWLARTVTDVRALDPHHLITAGWNEDSGLTIPYVDFISFHYWNQPEMMHTRIAALRASTAKPILLEEVGYSTRATGEAAQVDLLRGSLGAAEDEGLAGWLIWSAFDFTPDVTCIPPACPGKDNAEHHFGLWRADYTPKPSAQFLQARNGR